MAINYQAIERDGDVMLEHEGNRWAIDRETLDLYVVYPERFRPDVSDGRETSIHGVPLTAEHVAHDSGKGLPIRSIYGEIADGRLHASSVDYGDGTRCFADCYGRDLRVIS